MLGIPVRKRCLTTIHVSNLKVMLTEMFKTKNHESPEFMKEVFPLRSTHYILKYNNEFLSPKVKTISYRIETIRVIVPQLWQPLPTHIEKLYYSERIHKEKIRNCNPSDCQCVCVCPICHLWAFIQRG